MKKRSAFDQIPATMRRAEDRARQRDLAVCDADRQQVVARTGKIAKYLLVTSALFAGAIGFAGVSSFWFAIPTVLVVCASFFFLASYWLDKHFQAPSVLNDPDAYHEQRQALLSGKAPRSNPLSAAAAEQRERAKNCWRALTGLN